jgi:hypothetical protein
VTCRGYQPYCPSCNSYTREQVCRFVPSITTVMICLVRNYTKHEHRVTRRSWQDICGKLNGSRDRRIGLGVATTLRHGVQNENAFNLVYVINTVNIIMLC